MIALPRLIQVPSPNWSPRFNGVIDTVVAHDCQGSGRGAAGYFATPASKVSAHLVLDEDGAVVYQCVPLSAKAWHAVGANGYSIGVEMGGYAEKGFSDAELGSDALIVAWLLHQYAIPCRMVAGEQRGGWTTHYRLGAFGGGHTDFTTDPAKEAAFGKRVDAAYAELAKGPLPTWALHGMPAPHAVSLPPPPPPGWKGTPHDLRDDNNKGYNATLSGWPAGSVADLQWRLNRAGASPSLDIDGLFGDRTRSALVAFQSRHGLFVDGLLGPKSWAAIDAASV